MIVVTIVGMLAAIGIPAFAKARKSAQEEACLNNLRVIDGAKQQWGMENFQPQTAIPRAVDLDAYIKGGTATVCCPAGGRNFGSSYSINDLQTSPTCMILPSEHVE